VLFPPELKLEHIENKAGTLRNIIITIKKHQGFKDFSVVSSSLCLPATNGARNQYQNRPHHLLLPEMPDASDAK
jgi:hypothetical protein